MNTNSVVTVQKQLYEEIFDPDNIKKWEFHTTSDPLIRFMRDQGLYFGLAKLKKYTQIEQKDFINWRVLIVCGGVGGEGLFLTKYGFKHVTVSDFSENALQVCKKIAPEVKTIQLNAEDLNLDDNSFDLVFVRAGLHHLSRPALGVTEMLRVCKKAIIFFEPHTGFLSNIFGDEYENQNGVINFVYRWNKNMLEQTVKSFLLKKYTLIKCLRYWNHPVIIHKVVKLFPSKMRLLIAKIVYGFLNTIVPSVGNSMVGIVIK